MTVALIRCIGHVDGCQECAAETLRGGPRHVCDDLCVLKRAVRSEPGGHRRSHEPKLHTCGAVLDDRHGNNYEQITFCGWGTCVQFLCPGCGGFVFGYGPSGCACDNDPCAPGPFSDLIAEADALPVAKPSRLGRLFSRGPRNRQGG